MSGCSAFSKAILNHSLAALLAVRFYGERLDGGSMANCSQVSAVFAGGC